MEPLRTIFAPSRCPLKMQLSSQFPQLGPKTKSAQTRSLRAQTSNHWTNALAISYANPRSQLIRVLAVTANKYPHPKLWKRIWCHAGVHDFPHIFHLHNVTVTEITGRVANNIQRRPLVFLDHPCSFFVSKVMFQFPNNSRNEHFQRWRKSNQWPMFLFEIYLKVLHTSLFLKYANNYCEWYVEGLKSKSWKSKEIPGQNNLLWCLLPFYAPALVHQHFNHWCFLHIQGLVIYIFAKIRFPIKQIAGLLCCVTSRKTKYLI